MPNNNIQPNAANPHMRDDNHNHHHTTTNGTHQPPPGDDIALAEHLERNDDLCNSILVDQIGCERLKEGRLGVHHQQAKFVSPAIQPLEVLRIIRRVIKGGTVADGVKQIAELPVIRDHIASKPNKKRQNDVLTHLELYFNVYTQSSRVEIWRTDRYTQVSGHSELGVYATSMIAAGDKLLEIQGQCAEIPAGWLGDRGSDDDSDSDHSQRATRIRRRQRTGRRDFSIVNSSRYKKPQLFLGPARFINHDCNPNVELTPIDKNRISFTARRRILIGEELTTTYGDHYFDKNNSSCMCLSCEKRGKGYFAKNGPNHSLASAASRAASTRNGGGGDSDDDDEGGAGSPNGSGSPPSDTDTVAPPKRRAPHRGVRDDSQKLNFSKYHRPKKENYVPQRAPVDDPSAERCITCVDPLEDRFWVAGVDGGWDKFCPRCTRHALIFKMPWPAHRRDQMKNFPPPHLVPINYEAKMIRSEPIPSLGPRQKALADTPLVDDEEMRVRDLTLPAATKSDRAHWALLKQWSIEDAAVEQLRIQQWEWQEENDRIAADNARIKAERKRQRQLEKAERDKGKVKGSGVWSRYAYVDAKAQEKKIQERNNPVTRGTRSGRRLRQDSDEDEAAEAARRLEDERRRQQEAEEEDEDEEEDEGEEEDDEDEAEEQRKREEELREKVAQRQERQDAPRRREADTRASETQSPALSRTVRALRTPASSGSSAGQAEVVDLTLDESDDENAPIDMTLTSGDDEREAPAPNSSSPPPPSPLRPSNKRFVVVDPAQPPKRNGPGRPRGTGRRQIAARKKLEQEARRAEKAAAERAAAEKAAAAAHAKAADEARQRAAALAHGGREATVHERAAAPAAGSSSSAQRSPLLKRYLNGTAHASASRSGNADSADESSPPGAVVDAVDDADSPNSFSSSELDPPLVRAGRVPAPVSAPAPRTASAAAAAASSSAAASGSGSGSRKRKSTGSDSQPKHPRRFFNRIDGFRLPSLDVHERPLFRDIDEPPPRFC